MTTIFMKFILGKKIGMTQVFLPNGEVMPVTRVLAGPCTIVQVKEKEKAIQLGFGDKKEFRLNKPDAGHLKDLAPVSWLKEFSVEKTDDISRGDFITLETFAAGDEIQVMGVSKGKGFAGVVKRHHFRGGPASHGHKDNLRMPGSIGAGGVQRVFKGMRMAGHMGDAQVSINNLEIIEVFPEENILAIKGAVPGAKGSLLLISSPEGDIKGEVEKSKKEVEPTGEGTLIPISHRDEIPTDAEKVKEEAPVGAEEKK